MIGGKKRLLLCPENILSMITEYDIYRYYCTKPFKLNIPFNSPMPGRGDGIPSFLIGNKHGFMFHIDFGDSRYRGTCFDFVQQICMTPNFNETLKRIDRDFGLGISGGVVKDFKKEIITYEQPKMEQKRSTTIQVKVRKKFSIQELEYWALFHQTEEDLRREHIYPIKEYFINKLKFVPDKGELCFGYLYLGKYWKIYKPFSEDKWMSNVPIDTVDGLENIVNCEKAIVTKSKKDKMVLLKIFPCVCAVQNESIVALNEHTIKHLNENAKEVFINYDADAPGKKNSHMVTKLFGYKHINVPDSFVEEGVKDFADLAKLKGLAFVENYFSIKNLKNK
jgi:hypothetical protein